MNYKRLLGAAALIAPSLLFAQKEITVTGGNKDMSLGNKSAFVLVIPETKAKDIADDWEKQMKKEKGKVESGKSETKTTGATIKAVSAAPFTVYSSAIDITGAGQLSVWFMSGDSSVMSTDNSDKVSAIKKYLHDFGVQEYKASAKTQLEAEQKKSKQLDAVYNDFVKDQKKAEQNVADAQKEIEKLKDKNKDEEGNIERAKSSKESTNASVGKQDNLDAQKKTAKQVEGYIKDQQKAEDNIKNNNKRIDRLQEKIKEETAKAEKAKNLQGPALSNADAQKTVVSTASDKLNNIK